MRLLVLILSSRATEGKIIIRCYTQPQIQFYKSAHKSPISDKLFYVTLLYMTEKFCVYCQEVNSTLYESIWMFRVLQL